MPKLLVDGRHHAGRHLVSLFVRTWDDEGSRNPILTLLRAATIEPQAEPLASAPPEAVVAWVAPTVQR
jgi:hypothetical protein